MPSFRQAAFLEEAIGSVLDQDYPHRELIVMDGGSDDGSVAVIERHQARLAFWTSAPDGGQSDALDQGFLYKLQSKLPEGDPRLEMDEADYFDYQRSRALDEETFLQEYMCVPADDASAFLPWSLLDACVYPANTAWEYSLEQARARNVARARDRVQLLGLGLRLPGVA